MQNLQKSDPEVAQQIENEVARQRAGLEMIASENFVSRSVLEALGSPLTNKYSEGYPGKRYYGGNEFIDVIENLARDRACKLFGAEHANVQPHSGAQANMAVYLTLLKPGDTVLYTYGHYKRHYPRPSYTTAYAGWTRDAAEYVYGECGVLNVATDAPSMDMAHSPEYPCHLVCRDLGRTNTENLRNIEEVVGKEFLYIGLPLLIEDGSGSPCRVIAVLNA